jgi:Photosynthetic reaction centre cytochrome C subunit
MILRQAKLCALAAAVALIFFNITSQRATGATAEQDKPAQANPAPPQPDKPAEEVYKNIQVLKGLPSSRLMGVMGFFARSLGVKCNHCHVQGAFDSDEKPEKLTARKMYQMVQVANKELGSNRASCFTCHRGKVLPEPPPESWKAEAEQLMKDPNSDKRPAEQVYKNIQVLKGAPAGRWMLIMNMFSKSLGVDCAHCHVEGAFEKDDKPAKQTARKMLRMVGAIAKEIYKGPTTVTCYTCHKGQVEPVSFPPPPAQGAEKKPSGN